MSRDGGTAGEVRLTPMLASDIPELARIHQRAFAGFFLSRLGQPFLREIYRGYLEAGSAVHVVARRAATGAPLGVVVGTLSPAGFYRQLLRRRWLAFALAGARAAIRHPLAVAPRLLAALRYRGDAPPGTDGALLASLCVDPAASGQGLGGQLTVAWARAAAGRGAARAYLTTDADGNDAVNRHYQRYGWRIERTFTTAQGRRMHLYVKDLTGGQEAR